MRKVISILLLTIVMVCSMTACSSEKTGTSSPSSISAVANHISTVDQNEEKTRMTKIAELLNGKTLIEVYRSRPAAKMQEMYDQGYAEYLPGFKLKGYIYVDSLTEGLLMLRSGRADVLQVMDFSADYLGQRDSNLTVYKNPDWASYTHMIFSQESKSRYDKVNAAIKEMKQDGTLDKLVEKWITQLPEGEEPSGGEFPRITGADTLKVGISGDEPPLDYIAANGTPGGFNVAVLSEISRRAQIKIELVTVTGAARFTALESGKIGAFLWHNSSSSLNNMQRAPIATVKIGETALLATESFLDGVSAIVIVKK
jgi:ABC-type amino acid transport substrate-binding protein